MRPLRIYSNLDAITSNTCSLWLLLRTSRENQWLLIKGNDEFKSTDDLTITRPESDLTGRTNQDLENANTTHSFIALVCFGCSSRNIL